jgi:hypothetical protein
MEIHFTSVFAFLMWSLEHFKLYMCLALYFSWTVPHLTPGALDQALSRRKKDASDAVTELQRAEGLGPATKPR